MPSTLGRYQILGHLATGGMAEIFLAKLEGPGGFSKVVVIKRVLPHMARKPEFRGMFLDEARIVASLHHPNVVQVSELGQERDELFLVMEYLEGENLARVMRRLQGTAMRLDWALAAHVLACACAGLHAAHEYAIDGVPQELVHRDVSPQNLFITYDGSVKVIDFGVAKAVGRYTNTSTGQVKGKFAYMSPEQCLAAPLDRRTDVFALGIVLWEIVTTRRLFARDNELLVFHAICEQPIPSPKLFAPDLPVSLERIVMKALAREPNDRYATAADMRRDLLRVARELSPETLPEEALSLLMRQLFTERIEQKTELLKQVTCGVHVGNIEWMDGDSNVPIEIDTVDIEADTRSGTRDVRETAARTVPLTPQAMPSVPPVEPHRSRAWPMAVLALAVAAIGAAVGGYFLSGIDRSGRIAPPIMATAQTLETAVVPAAAEPTVQPSERPAVVPEPAPASMVTINLDSTPAGARVLVAGEERGVTPLALSLPSGTEAVEVGIELEGHESLLERITPDVNQRLRVQLVPASPARRAVRRRTTRAQPRPSGGFYRFD